MDIKQLKAQLLSIKNAEEFCRVVSSLSPIQVDELAKDVEILKRFLKFLKENPGLKEKIQQENANS
jgi:hypothetical protein